MKFINVTKNHTNVVKMMEKTMGEGKTVKFYDCKHEGTRLIHTYNKVYQCASLSSPNGKIKESEIKYAIEKILKTNLEDVSIFLSDTGVVHIHPLKNKTVID